MGTVCMSLSIDALFGLHPDFFGNLCLLDLLACGLSMLPVFVACVSYLCLLPILSLVCLVGVVPIIRFWVWLG
jgi:hypothetical protein